MASEKTLPPDIDNYRSYEKFLIYETATPVSNEKKVVSIDSNYRRMREDPKMLPENEVLNKNAIVKAPTAANCTTYDLATQGGNKTLGVVVLTNKLVLGCRLGTADKDYEIVEKKLEIPKPGNNERYFANRIEEDPESLFKD